MGRQISVQLDDDAEQALQTLEEAGLTTDQAIRASLLAAARRRRPRADVVAELAALDADEADRAEMREVARFMDALSAPR